MITSKNDAGGARKRRSNTYSQANKHETPVNMKLCLHDFVPRSYANGPGCRTVIWLQGCPFQCPGCYNPGTHPVGKGEWITVSRLFERVAALAGQIEGITISGGEPLMQLPALSGFLRLIKLHTRLSVIVFSGLSWTELGRIRTGEQAKVSDLPKEFSTPAARSALEVFFGNVDVVIAGRYVDGLRLANGLRGSANKTVHFLTDRYKPEDIEKVPCAEIVISAHGTVSVSGIDPPYVSSQNIN